MHTSEKPVFRCALSCLRTSSLVIRAPDHRDSTEQQSAMAVFDFLLFLYFYIPSLPPFTLECLRAFAVRILSLFFVPRACFKFFAGCTFQTSASVPIVRKSFDDRRQRLVLRYQARGKHSRDRINASSSQCAQCIGQLQLQ